MRPLRVDPLVTDVGTVAGHRLVLLSLEVYDEVADLRFARIDVDASRPLARRVPSADAWQVTVDGTPARVLDAVGRGDRSFSNGEVRLAPPPRPGARLVVTVDLARDEEPLTATVDLPGASA